MTGRQEARVETAVIPLYFLLQQDRALDVLCRRVFEGLMLTGVALSIAGAGLLMWDSTPWNTAPTLAALILMVAAHVIVYGLLRAHGRGKVPYDCMHSINLLLRRIDEDDYVWGIVAQASTVEDVCGYDDVQKARMQLPAWMRRRLDARARAEMQAIREACRETFRRGGQVQLEREDR